MSVIALEQRGDEGGYLKRCTCGFPLLNNLQGKWQLPPNITNRAFGVKAATKLMGRLFCTFEINCCLLLVTRLVGPGRKALVAHIWMSLRQEQGAFRAGLASCMDVSECAQQPVQTPAQLFFVLGVWSPSFFQPCRSSCGGAEITLNFVLTLLIKYH